MKLYIFTLLFLFILGCVSKTELSQISAGHIGCSRDNITISDHKTHLLTSGGTWVATCKDKRFICSEYSTGAGTKDVKCIEELE